MAEKQPVWLEQAESIWETAQAQYENMGRGAIMYAVEEAEAVYTPQIALFMAAQPLKEAVKAYDPEREMVVVSVGAGGEHDIYVWEKDTGTVRSV